MADSKISQLSAVTTLNDTDEFVLARSGTTKKITKANLQSEIGGGSRLAPFLPLNDDRSGSSNTNALGLTLDFTPTQSNVLIACIVHEDTGNVTSISQTNVTWTQIAESPDGTAPKVEIWRGVVGASPSTSLTVNFSTTAFSAVHVSEWDDANVSTSTASQVAAENYTSDLSGTWKRFANFWLDDAEEGRLVVAVMSTTNNSTTFQAVQGLSAFDEGGGGTLAVGYGFPEVNELVQPKVVGGSSSTCSSCVAAVGRA